MNRKTPSLTLTGSNLVEILAIIAWKDVDLAVMLAKQAGVDAEGIRQIDPDGIVKY